MFCFFLFCGCFVFLTKFCNFIGPGTLWVWAVWARWAEIWSLISSMMFLDGLKSEFWLGPFDHSPNYLTHEQNNSLVRPLGSGSNTLFAALLRSALPARWQLCYRAVLQSCVCGSPIAFSQSQIWFPPTSSSSSSPPTPPPPPCMVFVLGCTL